MRCEKHPEQNEFFKQVTTECKINYRGVLTDGDVTATTRIICPKCDDLIFLEKTIRNRRDR